MDKRFTWNSHIERTQESASEQILLVIGISPALDGAHTSAITLLLDEECLVYLPSLSSDNSGERELGVAWNDVDGRLTIIGRPGG